jgi:hypothetical protein
MLTSPVKEYLRQAMRSEARIRALEERIGRARMMGARAVSGYTARGVQEKRGSSLVERAAIEA